MRIDDLHNNNKLAATTTPAQENIFPFWINNKNLIHLRLISTSTPSQGFARLSLQSEVIVAPNVRKSTNTNNNNSVDNLTLKDGIFELDGH